MFVVIAGKAHTKKHALVTCFNAFQIKMPAFFFFCFCFFLNLLIFAFGIHDKFVFVSA